MTSDEYKQLSLFAIIMGFALTGTYVYNHRKVVLGRRAKTFRRRRYAKHHWREV